MQISQHLCAQMIYQIFPLPCKTSLYNKYGDKLNEIKLDLTDIKRLPNVLQSFREMYQVPKEKQLNITLRIDAFNFRSFVSCGMTPLKAKKNESCLSENNCDDNISNRNDDDDLTEEISKILQIGKTTDDGSKLGKMRDNYVINLYTFENVEKLIQNECYASACALFPYACIVTVLFSTRISIEFRILLIKLTFHDFVKILSHFTSLKEKKIYLKGEKSTFLTIGEEHYFKRILNTIVAFGIALMFGDKRLRLDTLSTHLVENNIGIARQTSFDPRWERILTTYCHAETRKLLAVKYGIIIHVQN